MLRNLSLIVQSPPAKLNAPRRGRATRLCSLAPQGIYRRCLSTALWVAALTSTLRCYIAQGRFRRTHSKWLCYRSKLSQYAWDPAYYGDTFPARLESHSYEEKQLARTMSIAIAILPSTTGCS